MDIDSIIEKYNGCKISVKIEIDNYDSQFKIKNLSNISLVRCILKKFNIENIINAKNICNKLINLGYEVVLNLNNYKLLIIAAAFARVSFFLAKQKRNINSSF